MDALFRVQWVSGQLILPPDEARHAVRVLRKRTGAVIHGIDGSGKFIEAAIGVPNNDGSFVLNVLGYADAKGESPVDLHLILPLLAHRDRLEWMVEKSNELGATHVTICRFERCETSSLNLERINKLIWASMKQCKRASWMEIQVAKSLHEAIHNQGFETNLYACTCDESVAKSKLCGFEAQDNPICWVIGPEGDLSPKEIQLMKEQHATWIDLGRARLRAETAAVHVLSLTKSLLGY
jgi:16S rRNA (uracil1498-N3)-methyltransferase